MSEPHKVSEPCKCGECDRCLFYEMRKKISTTQPWSRKAEFVGITIIVNTYNEYKQPIRGRDEYRLTLGMKEFNQFAKKLRWHSNLHLRKLAAFAEFLAVSIEEMTGAKEDKSWYHNHRRTKW